MHRLVIAWVDDCVSERISLQPFFLTPIYDYSTHSPSFLSFSFSLPQPLTTSGSGSMEKRVTRKAE